MLRPNMRFGPFTSNNPYAFAGSDSIVPGSTTFTAIRHASVSVVLAIGTASPIITTLLQFMATRNVELAAADVAGLAITVLAVAAIIVIGVRQENQACRVGQIV